jgi:type IV pilus assembly protein PilC
MNYFYEAVDESGKVVLGRIDAADEAEVHRKLQQLGYRPQAVAPHPAGANSLSAVAAPSQAPLQGVTLGAGSVAVGTARTAGQSLAQSGSVARSGGITMAGNAAKVVAKNSLQRAAPSRLQPATAPANPNASNLGGVSTRDLMFFFQQLSSLAKSGISLYAALENLAARTHNRNLARTAAEMAEKARTGGRISDVMEHYPRIYPPHIIGMIRAGELGGFLDIALSEMAHNYEQNIALYRGSWIPKLMATQAFFMFALVQPISPTLFPNAQFGTYILYVLRNLVISGALYGLIRMGARHIQLPAFRRLRDKLALRMPPFGDLQRQAALAAFIRMLRRLYHAGVAPIHAWEGAMNTATNVVIRDKLADSYVLMEQGASLPDAFTATGLFTNSVENLILTGHQSGEVVESLDKSAEYYQGQVAEAFKKSQFMMLRFGVLAMLILGGFSLIWLVQHYFSGIFQYVDDNFKPD